MSARRVGLVAVAAVLLAATWAAAQSPTPDTNCDARVSAADFSAPILVSADGAQLPDCANADPFRDRALDETDFEPIVQELFHFFEVPWTPTVTATATETRTPTVTRTPSPTGTPSTTPTVSPSSLPTDSPSPTLSSTPEPTGTPTLTATGTATLTATVSRTPTVTRTATVTPTPTGLAYRLSGRWAADWTNQICFLNGQAFAHLPDTVYIVTAVDGQLDIETVTGDHLGRGLTIQPDGSVSTRFRTDIGQICNVSGILEEFIFDYVFTFQVNGTGSASTTWSYGLNTFCAVCTVNDTAILRRVSGPPP